MAPTSRAAVAGLVVLAGCASAPPRAPVADAPLGGTAESRRAEFVTTGWAFELGATRQEIIRNLGEPAAVDTEAVVNRHRPELTDTIYTLEYEGLVARVYDVSATGKQIVTHLILKSADYATRWQLGVGATADRVIRVLGEPTARLQDELLYQDGGPAPESVVFYLEDGVVVEIEWRFYID